MYVCVCVYVCVMNDECLSTPQHKNKSATWKEMFYLTMHSTCVCVCVCVCNE